MEKKTIKPYYDDWMELYCSSTGCEDKLVVSIDKDMPINDDAFWFEIRYCDPCNLWQRMKRAFSYIKGWKEPEIAYDGIFLNDDQIKEMCQTLMVRVEKHQNSQEYKRWKHWKKTKDN